MPRKIFISYRRKSADLHAAKRLHSLLVPEFAADQVFLDGPDIAPGADISGTLRTALDQTGILLAVIGPGWHDSMDRLHQPGDFVAMELDRGLNFPNRITIPLLVNGAAMPAADSLPKSLIRLATRNAIALHDDSFEDIVSARLLRALRETYGAKLTTFDELPDQIYPVDRQTIEKMRDLLAKPNTRTGTTPVPAAETGTASAWSTRLREGIRDAVDSAIRYRRPIDQEQLESRVYGYGPEDVRAMSERMILDGDLVEARDGTLRLPPFRYTKD